MLDFSIFLKTIWNVVSMKGISSETSVTMEKFQGKDKSDTEKVLEKKL